MREHTKMRASDEGMDRFRFVSQFDVILVTVHSTLPWSLCFAASLPFYVWAIVTKLRRMRVPPRAEAIVAAVR
jgi:hypothetical protein